MLLLTVQVECNLAQVEVLEIERITSHKAVERPISYETDDDACRQLTREQFLVTHIQIMLRNGKRLAHHTSYRILRRPTFKSLGMCEKNRRQEFNFPHEKRRMSYVDFSVPHHAESILAANKFYLDTNFIEHVTILKEHVGMQTTHHVEFATLPRDKPTFHQTVVSSSSIVRPRPLQNPSYQPHLCRIT